MAGFDHGVVEPSLLEDGDADGIDGDAVGAGQKDAGVLARSGHRALVDEGHEAVDDDDRRLVSGVDLGDHPPLVGRAVELAHIIVSGARHDPDGVSSATS